MYLVSYYNFYYRIFVLIIRGFLFSGSITYETRMQLKLTDIHEEGVSHYGQPTSSFVFIGTYSAYLDGIFFCYYCVVDCCDDGH